MVTTGITAVVWIVVMLITPPESEAVIETFVRQVQPPGLVGVVGVALRG